MTSPCKTCGDTGVVASYDGPDKTRETTNSACPDCKPTKCECRVGKTSCRGGGVQYYFGNHYIIRCDWCKKSDMKLARAGTHIARVDGANKRLEAKVERLEIYLNGNRTQLNALIKEREGHADEIEQLKKELSAADAVCVYVGSILPPKRVRRSRDDSYGKCPREAFTLRISIQETVNWSDEKRKRYREIVKLFEVWEEANG